MLIKSKRTVRCVHGICRTARTSTPNDIARRDSGPHARCQQLQRGSSLGEPLGIPVRSRLPARLLQLTSLWQQQRTAGVLPETRLEEPRAPLMLG